MWRRIIEKMYDPKDQVLLENRFATMLETKRLLRSSTDRLTSPGTASATSKKMTREELNFRASAGDKLTYFEFSKAILDFQLSEHEKFLHDFTALFKAADRDRNGILNEAEFRDLLEEMRVLPSTQGDEAL